MRAGVIEHHLERVVELLELADLPARPPQVRLLVDRRRLDHEHETRRRRRDASSAARAIAGSVGIAANAGFGSHENGSGGNGRSPSCCTRSALASPAPRHCTGIVLGANSPSTLPPRASVASSSAVSMTLKAIVGGDVAHRFRRLAFGGLREVLHRRRRARCRDPTPRSARRSSPCRRSLSDRRSNDRRRTPGSDWRCANHAARALARADS